MKYKKALTLAEVLITLLIIGIVASLVIPSLINNINNEESVVAAKKMRSTLSQASALIKMDNGGTYVEAFQNTSDTVNKFAERLVYTAKCTSGINNGTCWHLDNTMMKTLDGANWPTTSLTNTQGLKLNDGTLLWIGLVNKDCSDSATWSNNTSDANNPFNYVCSLIIFDVNGFKPPNRMGRDIYEILLTKNGLHAVGEAGSLYGKQSGWNLCTPGNGNGNGASCLSRIFEEGGMYY